MYVVVCNNGSTRDHRTYTHVFSADVQGWTIGRTLTDSTPYFVNSIANMRSKVPDVRYFLD
jgi:hypothetical protein